MDELEKVLVKHRSKKFLVIEPGGDNGDRLIYMGLEKKLKELGITFTVLRYKETLPFQRLYFGLWKRILEIAKFLSRSNTGLKMAISKMDKNVYERSINVNEIQADPSWVILIQGGGNINDLWGNGIRLLRNVIQHNQCIIIVAPQTYWFKETSFSELFRNVGQEIYLFCRERYSYKLLNSMNLPENIHILLSHDTAFYLSKEDFHVRIGNYDLICLRTDKESAVFQKTTESKRVMDLRQSQRRIFVGDVSLLDDFRDFVNIIEGSRRVYTDRLHVAILATILDKSTILYPNSYYKNRGVYEFSLSKYPNVKFVNDLKAVLRVGLPNEEA